MIVLDANILIRAILGRRVRELLDRYADQGLRFFAADAAFDEAENISQLSSRNAARLRRTSRDH